MPLTIAIDGPVGAGKSTISDEEAKKKGKNAYVSINWAQAIFLVVFKDEVLEQQVEMEDANEGEHYENE